MPDIVNEFNKFETRMAGPAGRHGLYCVWVRSREIQGGPLIALWIDPQMRALEQSLSNSCESVVSPAVATRGDDPDDEDGPCVLREGMALYGVPFQTTVFTRQQQSAATLRSFLSEGIADGNQGSTAITVRFPVRTWRSRELSPC
jgi:hypothetical protein